MKHTACQTASTRIGRQKKLTVSPVTTKTIRRPICYTVAQFLQTKASTITTFSSQLKATSILDLFFFFFEVRYMAASGLEIFTYTYV